MRNIAKTLEKVGFELMKQTLLVGFSGILDIDQIEHLEMMKDKSIDGKEL